MEFATLKSAAAGAGDDGEIVRDSSSAGFVKDVIDASRHHVVLVDFWAPWCGPCKQLTPLLEKIVKSYGGRVHLVKINTDQHQAIAAQLRVQSLPTVYAFKDGRPIDGFLGAQPESAIRAMIDGVLGDEGGDELAETLETADQALQTGDLQQAAEAFAAVLQVDQQNPDALAGLARCYLKSGDLNRAEQTIGLVPPDKQTVPAVEGVRAALDLARAAETAGDHKQLERKVAANPADHQARFDFALALVAQGLKAEAVDQLLELVKRDRIWNDQAARKQLVQLFDAWGGTDPLTNEGRRRLSSILFS